MSIAKLTTIASEESTFAVAAAFTDDADAAVVPDTLTWTLSDLSGTIINSRDQVSVVSPASTTTIVLSGADLALQAGESGKVKRRLTVEGTYTSSLGAGLPLTAECEFLIEDLVNV